ncbi:YjzD family protein [Siminovitchia sp. FSL H7-0308]|uniref:YjzD family protein n=1 Tax=Siminovitchia TaxID=2837510 RepID=UPI00269CC313|nr:YjzD family protein [Siminovitchia thermophila]
MKSLRYIVTIFWTFLLVNMVMYVGGSMIGSTYDFKTASMLSAAVSILIFIASAILPQPVEEK